jgi:hypothetical protein
MAGGEGGGESKAYTVSMIKSVGKMCFESREAAVRMALRRFLEIY